MQAIFDNARPMILAVAILVGWTVHCDRVQAGDSPAAPLAAQDLRHSEIEAATLPPVTSTATIEPGRRGV